MLQYCLAVWKEAAHESKVQRMIEAEKERYALMESVHYERAVLTLIEAEKGWFALGCVLQYCLAA